MTISPELVSCFYFFPVHKLYTSDRIQTGWKSDLITFSATLDMSAARLSVRLQTAFFSEASEGVSTASRKSGQHSLHLRFDPVMKIPQKQEITSPSENLRLVFLLACEDIRKGMVFI